MQHRAPIAPLAEFVDLFWYWSGHSREFERERILPMPAAELVIQLNGSHRFAGFSGPRSTSFLIERRRTDALLGIHFKPGGAFPFIGCAFGELHNVGITLIDLWGEKKARRLVDLLDEAPTVEMKFQTLERWLMWISDRPIRHHPAVCFALEKFQQDPGIFTSEQVAQTANLSQRRFIELFRDGVGMTPKLFCRVQRFQNIIRTIGHQPTVEWVDLALSHGYSDQSHFIHDFRAFSGLSPTEYLPLRTGSSSHVRLAE